MTASPLTAADLSAIAAAGCLCLTTSGREALLPEDELALDALARRFLDNGPATDMQPSERAVLYNAIERMRAGLYPQYLPRYLAPGRSPVIQAQVVGNG